MNGPHITTSTGRAFSLMAPTAAMVEPEALAYALSNIARWGGHARPTIYVAEHCCRVADVVAASLDGAPPDTYRRMVLAAALHDAHEAITGDIAAPVKAFLGRAIQDLEDEIDAAIADRFRLTVLEFHHPVIKRADMILRATEARDLMPPSVSAGIPEGVRALPGRIIPWAPAVARDRFLRLLEAFAV